MAGQFTPTQIPTKSGGTLTIDPVRTDDGTELVKWEWRAADGYLLADGTLTPQEAREIGMVLCRVSGR